jgi:hypothetical protein
LRKGGRQGQRIGNDERKIEEGDEEELGDKEVKEFRGNAAKMNYLAQDCPGTPSLPCHPTLLHHLLLSFSRHYQFFAPDALPSSNCK